jgi:hypothetical protein
MGRSDRLTILLSVAALCGTIIGTSCSTNAHISDMNARMDAVTANVNARIGDVNGRIDDLSVRIGELRSELRTDIRELRAIVIDAIKAATPAAD